MRMIWIALLSMACSWGGSAFAESKSEFEVQNWTKSKCMNFRSNKDVSSVEMALKQAYDEREFSEALTIASELMDDKLGCQQRYDIADFGYKSAVGINDFASAQKFMPVMRKYLEQKGRDVVFFDQLIRWVDENKAAHDPEIEVADRHAFAVRDRTLHYVFQEFKNKPEKWRTIPRTECEVVFSINVYGRPGNVNADCDRSDVAEAIEKHLPKMLFAPKILDGKPVAQEQLQIKVNIG